MKRVLVCLLAALLVLTVLGGCGAVKAPDDTYTTYEHDPANVSRLDGATPGSTEPTEKENTPTPTAIVVAANTPTPVDSIVTGGSNTSPDTTENVKNYNSAYSGYTVVLDPGHGGKFTGATYYERVEKDLTLLVGIYVRDYLVEWNTGITVYMTRETDITLSSDLATDLEMRAEVAENANADILVSLHFNAISEHDATGAEALISLDPDVNDACRKLGACILDELTALGLKNRGLTTRKSNDLKDSEGNALDYYAINRHCALRNIPGIIIEHCFMDNKNDIEFLDSDEDLRALAEADALGIISYFEKISQ